MNKTVSHVRIAACVRWAARGLSALLLLFWGFFLVAHLFGGEGQPSRALTSRDRILFGMMLLWLFGLALAWKWELAGALLTLAAFAVAAGINPRVASGLSLLPPLAALAFLLSWWLSWRSWRDL